MTALFEKFLAHFQHGVGKPNRFEVVLNLPSGVQRKDYYVDDMALKSNLREVGTKLNSQGGVNIKCHTVTFPQRSLRTYTHNQNSAPFEVPFTAVYDPVTMMFYSDGFMDTREFLENWQFTVVNGQSNTLNFYKEFVSDVELYVLDETDVRTYGVRLINAFPIAVGAVDFAYSNFDNPTVITATFAYKRWEKIKL